MRNGSRHFPRKHFYAVFNTYDKWNFSRLPRSYVSNVFITLDYSGFAVEEHLDHAKETMSSKRKMDSEDDDDFEDRPQDDDGDWAAEDTGGDQVNASNNTIYNRKSPAHRSTIDATNIKQLRKSILEKASLVRNAMYSVDDPECFKETLKNLTQVHQSLLCKIPNKGGLPVRTSPTKKRLRVTSMDYHKVFHKKLPLRRRRKTLKTRKDVTVDSKSSITIDLTSSPESSPKKVRIIVYFFFFLSIN